ncbi:MAG: hypothetical protein AAFO77_12170 [Pseudomonadota bacterium]
MTKKFGRLASRNLDDAYSRFGDVVAKKTRRNALDENITWASYFILVFTATTQFAPEAAINTIAVVAQYV